MNKNISFLWVVFFVGSGSADPSQSARARPEPTTQPDLDKVSKLIIARTNEFRTTEKRGQTTENSHLKETAHYFANFMAKTGKYGHDADEQTPADRASKHGYKYCLIAENIAYQFRSTAFSMDELAGRFFEGWKKSPGHRKNMLDPDLTETAVVIARSESTGYYYAVQLFGRPQSLLIDFSVANQSGMEVKYHVGEQDYELKPNMIRTHRYPRHLEIVLGAKDAKKELGAAPPMACAFAQGDSFVILLDDGKLVLKKEGKK